MTATEALERRIDELCAEVERLRGQVASLTDRSIRMADKMNCLNAENAKLRGWWTHDGTWHVELPKLPEGIAVTMPDSQERNVRTARVWRYEPARTCRIVKEHVGRSGQAHRLVCSECHHVIYDGWQDKPRYCAFCGSRMEDE